MKRIFTIPLQTISLYLLSVCVVCTHLQAQVSVPPAYASPTDNYVLTSSATAPITDPAALAGRPVSDVKQTTQYIDGLGRPLQTVIKQGSLETSSGNNADLVKSVVYDALGREVYQYLPFPASSNDGSFKINPFQQQAAFFGSGSTSNPVSGQGETFYYGQTNYETSPLGRPVMAMAPGNSWAGSTRGIQTGYWINTATDDVKIWNVANGGTTGVFGSYSMAGSYPAGRLYKNITTDENNKQVIEFKDKEDIFLASLAYYVLTRGGKEILEASPQGWDNIEKFLRSVLSGHCSQEGCFIIYSMRDYALLSPTGKKNVMRHLDKLRRFVLKNMENVQSSVDAEQLTDILLIFFAGLALSQNSEASVHSEESIRAFLDAVKQL